MNQFKKAKQLRNETGQATESITDLTTAGITQKQDNTEPSITNDKTESQNPADTGVTLEKNFDEKEHTTQAPNNTTNTSPVTITPPIAGAIKETIYNQPIVQPTVNPVTVPSNIYNITNDVPSTTLEVMKNTVPEPLDIAPQANNVPVVVRETALPNYIAPVEYKNETIPPVITQPLNIIHSPQEMTTVTQPPAKKKTAPNIFAPKSEAKSMRKSLVLKPTSVKIAENYCEKNGGSFNELIQTLLDNFIDEYGL